jgi:general stress protein YciG
MNKNDSIREYLSKIGKRGGTARAAKFDKATLSTWAKKGGRPPKKDRKKGTNENR